MSDDGRYGVEVIGGTNLGVNANDPQHNDMGIAGRGPSSIDAKRAEEVNVRQWARRMRRFAHPYSDKAPVIGRPGISR